MPESTASESVQKAAGLQSGNRVVLFADILGFGALTEANPIDLRMLQFHSRPFSATTDDFFELISVSKNPLTEPFSKFHTSLKGAISLAEMKHPLTAITFSDSVFIVTNYLFQATSLAADFALDMLSYRVPVRMGIAFGSFAALRFRSDVSAEGGDHASQFLGTGIVRAHEAESCGIKGMRILIHPSVESILTNTDHCPVQTPVGSEVIMLLDSTVSESANRAGVRRELNYWDLAASRERSAWHGLQDMWAAAPDGAKHHYHATAEASNRMRIAQGEGSLSNLCRRTLPRRRG